MVERIETASVGDDMVMTPRRTKQKRTEVVHGNEDPNFGNVHWNFERSVQ